MSHADANDHPAVHAGRSAVIVTATAATALRAALARSRARFVRVLPLGGGPSGLGFGLSLTRAPLSSDVVRDVDGLSICLDRETDVGPLEIDYDARGPRPAFVLSPLPPASRSQS